VRNVFFATNAFALVLYETYPLAPPRLASNLTFDGQAFHFVDTMWQVLGADGKVVGTQIGYNEFAAMPSLHVGWALIVALGLAWTLHSTVVRLLVLTYPALMLLIVVITGNHYIMDAVGAAVIVLLAIGAALLYAWWRAGWGSFAMLLRRLHDMRFDRAIWTAASRDVMSVDGEQAVA
jgi:membrane-associated phospholipid phosphatase